MARVLLMSLMLMYITASAQPTEKAMALTITAQAERAMSLWPNKGESDQRPAQNAPYKYLAPIKPINPVVPEGAYGALKLIALEAK